MSVDFHELGKAMEAWWREKSEALIYIVAWTLPYPALVGVLYLVIHDQPVFWMLSAVIMFSIFGQEAYMGDRLSMKYGTYVWLGALLTLAALLFHEYLPTRDLANYAVATAIAIYIFGLPLTWLARFLSRREASINKSKS